MRAEGSRRGPRGAALPHRALDEDKPLRRAIFFDIDGTLVSGGPAKDAFREAMTETYGTAGDFAEVGFDGKTDPSNRAVSCWREPASDRNASMPVLRSSGKRMRRGLARALPGRPMTVFARCARAACRFGGYRRRGRCVAHREHRAGREAQAGIRGIVGPLRVRKLRLRPRGARRIVCGRARSGAGGMASRAGGGKTRSWLATRRATCGAAAGAGHATLAVATGRFGAGELRRAGADHVVKDLSATQAVLRLLVR